MIHINSILLIQEVAFTCKVLLRRMKQKTQNPYKIINIHSNGSQKNANQYSAFQDRPIDWTLLRHHFQGITVPRRVIDDNGSGHPLVSSRCEHRVIMLTPVCKYYNCSATRIVVTLRNGCVYMQ